MCLLYGLVPVCLMYRLDTNRWDADPVIRSLAARDLWAHGGAERVADMLEAQEDAEREKLRRETRQYLWDLSGEAWRSYQRRTGQSVSMVGENRRGRDARPGRREVNGPFTSGSTAGSGPAQAMFVHDR